MLIKSFDARVRHAPDPPELPIIDLYGEINTYAKDTLKNAYAEASRQNPAAILLNFGSVDYINSAGIALIVGLVVQARKAGCRLMICGLSEHYIKIFRITRLVDFVSIFPDEASALAAAPASG